MALPKFDHITIDDRDRAIAGDHQSQAKMIDAVQPLTYAYMNRQRVPMHDRDDCWQDVSITLLETIRRWDPGRGSWITFAGTRAKFAIRDWQRHALMLRGFGRANQRFRESPQLMSIDALGHQDRMRTLLDRTSDSGIMGVDSQDLLEVLSKSRSTAEKCLAYYCFGGLKMWQIGKVLGLSESRVSQCISEATKSDYSRARLRRLLGVER